MFDDILDRGKGDSPLFVETNVGTVFSDPPQQSAAALVSGVLGDLQRLVEQQFRLTRREIESEIRQRAIAGAVFVLGGVILFLGAVVACFGLADLLHWATLPRGTDPAWLPLWACDAMVAAVLTVLGGFLVHVGRVKFISTESFHNPLSELLREQTL